VSYKHKNDVEKVYKCKHLGTRAFGPKKRCIWGSLQDREVAAYIRETWLKRPVYMATTVAKKPRNQDTLLMEDGEGLFMLFICTLITH